ncbi:hypothetical protein BVC80_8485g8 [Macleaya cordata]|uniref:AB hydrolase-1 domain-containing protein n=1 Tax=Macleaya cordata TaxID=56857 RepID=A0A200R147_MACCD|nr:hypothetical protein BVC80_8485g8 [Macleaya cordata]
MDVGNGHGLGLVESLNARVYGNGSETLVLSHGFGVDQTVWHFILPYLACYFKVVIFDMVFSPNVKPSLYDPKRYSDFDSYAEDLVNLLDQLKVNKTIYLGHSMSAMIGCIAATERPDLFTHLILLGGSPRYLNDVGYTGGFERSDIESILNEMNHNFSNWVTNFSPKAVGVYDTNAVKEFKSSLERMKPGIALEVAKTVFLSDLRYVLKQVKNIPCTIIQSEKDIVVPKSVAFYMQEMLGSKNNTTVEI